MSETIGDGKTVLAVYDGFLKRVAQEQASPLYGSELGSEWAALVYALQDGAFKGVQFESLEAELLAADPDVAAVLSKAVSCFFEGVLLAVAEQRLAVSEA